MYIKRNTAIDQLKILFLNGLSLLFKSISFLFLTIKGWSRQTFPGNFIVSIDNLSFGGTGKTTLVMAIGAFLESRQVPFAIVMRGYKSQLEKEKKATAVALHHTVEQVGDEAKLLARRFPHAQVYVGHNRLDAIRQAQAKGLRFIILDDGFQSTHIHKNLKIMLFNSAHPYYYLRHFKMLLKREDIVLYLNQEVLGPSVAGYSFQLSGFFDATGQSVELHGQDFVAFAALGDNQRFLQDLAPYHPLDFKGFKDHYPFSKIELEKLDQWRREHHARYLVCTEKDFMKIFPYNLTAIPFIYARNSIKFNIDLMSFIWNHAEEEKHI